ncbi:hypothetical protein [Marinomonas rhodophyticola]|uniref:Outer membrane protein beta-barrel domain-containing protein n=1 Tax=Marinomonas rhodophyticola TaxID=2992803 RepID=A0ABT3KBV0_9GAMM|nr:hypothetical protein [Marinomonas sp. KJ51-3]MCW4628011.1 hypothetical protein [Marinomonas sp. KJ51-3]
MNLFSRFFLSSLLLSTVVQAKDTATSDKDSPNFVFGLGYGLLDQKSLLNIDFKVNIPISEHVSTQVLLNSNYLITGFIEGQFCSV